MKLLFEAYPEWSDLFVQKVAERQERLFGGVSEQQSEGRYRPIYHIGNDVAHVDSLGAREEVDVVRKYIWVDILHMVLLVFSYVEVSL